MYPVSVHLYAKMDPHLKGNNLPTPSTFTVWAWHDLPVYIRQLSVMLTGDL